MYRRIILCLVVGAVSTIMVAAVPATDDFESFRRNLLKQHEQFRQDIMKDYADFLDSAWEEFESIKGDIRNPKPKPINPTKVPEKDSAPRTLPTPPPPTEITPINETPASTPSVPVKVPTGATLDFYGINIDVPQPNFQIQKRLNDSNAFADQWRAYSSNPSAAELAKRLESVAASLGLNDYLTFDFIRQYVNANFRSTHSTARASLVHYLMSALGYDVRIAMSNGEGFLLVPTQQTIYGSPYLLIDSRKYYVFADGNASAGSRISTCRLPSDANTGRPFDMHLKRPLTVPVKPRPFSLQYEDVVLAGELNENIYPLLYYYPQTDMEVYASSVIDHELRKNLVEQLKSQLSGKAYLESINSLLKFTQNAIEYATDDAYHGFEKPYFLEEWLYYPKNDCEDRSVFYSYMLWNVLGVECQMITYPGHESVAVCLDETINGDNYSFDGKTFYISDPTYIGAVTGQCMPDFVDTPPEIEYHYK